MDHELIELTKKKTEQRISNPMRRLMTVQESAEYLGRSIPSFREMLYGHKIKVIQNGRGKVWIDIKDLDAWIDQNKSFM
jgi:excisionase family DNA binding protein